MYNLSYKTPYHDEIRQKMKKQQMENKYHHWEPMVMHSAPWDYRDTSKEEDEDRYEEIHDRLVRKEKKGGFYGEKIAHKGAKVAEAVASTAASIGLDITFDEGIKAAAIAAGAEVGVPPFLAAAIGKVVGKFVRKEIEKKTGLGRSGAVGEYSPDQSKLKSMETYAKKGLSVGADIVLKDALPAVTDYVGKQLGVPSAVSKAIGKKTGIRVRKALKEKTGIGRPIGPDSKLRPRKANPWVAHVKRFAKDHKLNYSQALKDPRCKASYKK